ncbi:MAG: hypothetical protein KDA42_12440 [Planctomycetales bacterium]|nr:hypothetical protein [Planctomycetales bacterium]
MVQISFECIPLRTVGRFDIPLDASPAFQQRCERIKQAIETHGQHNSYFLHDGSCEFRLTNHDTLGLLRFAFAGTVLTDTADLKTRQVDLEIALVGESCDWLTRDVATWFEETVRRAVACEFDHYIAAGDLTKTKERIAALQRESEAAGGFLGMDL